MAAGICCHPLTWRPSSKNKLSCSTAGDKCLDMQELSAIDVYRATGRTAIDSSCSIKHCSELILVSKRCGQLSGAPVGPGGGTAKSPGRDRTAKRSPPSSLIPTLGQLEKMTGRDDRMPSVLVNLVFDSYLSGNFRK